MGHHPPDPFRQPHNHIPSRMPLHPMLITVTVAPFAVVSMTDRRFMLRARDRLSGHARDD